jgi:hypothetical protein
MLFLSHSLEDRLRFLCDVMYVCYVEAVRLRDMVHADAF